MQLEEVGPTFPTGLTADEYHPEFEVVFVVSHTNVCISQ